MAKLLRSYIYSHSSDPSPAVQNFLSNYKQLFGEEPDMFAAQAYDAAHCHWGDKAKGTDPEQIREGYRNGLPGITGNTSIDEEGDTIKDVLILKVEGGTFDRIR